MSQEQCVLEAVQQ